MFKIYVRYKLHRKMTHAYYCSTTPSHKSLRLQTNDSCHSIFLSPYATYLYQIYYHKPCKLHLKQED